MLLSLFAALAAPAPEEGPTYTVTVDDIVKPGYLFDSTRGTVQQSIVVPNSAQ